MVNLPYTGIFSSRYIFANFAFLYKFTKTLLRKILVGVSGHSLINSCMCGLLLHHPIMMALFKYFKPKHKAKHDILPDPHGPLTAVISPSAIETANQCILKELEKSQEEKSSSQGHYRVYLRGVWLINYCSNCCYVAILSGKISYTSGNSIIMVCAVGSLGCWDFIL